VQGPTASGKTELAICLAQFLGTEIISADSRQFYTEMNIGTAKPSDEELSEVYHHFVNNRSIANPLNVANFAAEAQPVLLHLLQTKGATVVVGGSGQFVDALVNGLNQVPHYPEIQSELNDQLSTDGLESLVQLLRNLDPSGAECIDVKNPRRVIRALEVRIGSGKSMVDFFDHHETRNFKVIRCMVNWKRQDLYDRINKRVDLMLASGLEKEVKGLALWKETAAMNTVGYKEWFDFFSGSTTKADAIEKIKQHTRNYAKRQLTWLNRYEDLIKLNPYVNESPFEQILPNLVRH
jgi:tRNA dimethylallyltransferase